MNDDPTRPRREKLMAARFEWLDERDLGGVAADIREGVPLTDILRERADNGPLVHQLATWIDEDQANYRGAFEEVARTVPVIGSVAASRFGIDPPRTDTRKVEPLRDGAYRILCGLVQPADVIDPADVIGSEMDWEQLRRIFPAADASTIDNE